MYTQLSKKKSQRTILVKENVHILVIFLLSGKIKDKPMKFQYAHIKYNLLHKTIFLATFIDIDKTLF